jgi:hypothetical protein
MNGYDSGDPEQEKAWCRLRRREGSIFLALLALAGLAVLVWLIWL